MTFHETDHKQLTEMIDSVLNAVVMTQVSVPQARDALTNLLTAAASGNETEVRDWFNPERIDRWKEECRKANEQT
jgi:hypothetical protein